MNTAPYSQDYFPPAPVLPVSIAVPDGSHTRGPWLALVDTGADGTFVPTEMLEELQAPLVYMTNVRSHLGERLHRVPVHKVDIVLFDSFRLSGMEVVGDDWGDCIIIGRNVLNRLRLDLDGPGERTSVRECRG
jgi:predicted aspartyl protease